MMKKLKIVLLLSAMMALSIGGFVKSQSNKGITYQSIEQLVSLNNASASSEKTACWDSGSAGTKVRCAVCFEDNIGGSKSYCWY